MGILWPQSASLKSFLATKCDFAGLGDDSAGFVVTSAFTAYTSA